MDGFGTRGRYPSYAMNYAALHFLILTVAGWMSRHQVAVIEYLIEENRVLREQLNGRRIRLTDAQRRRLARKGKAIGRKRLGELRSYFHPDTILRWYRELVARKYDGSRSRGPGRPRIEDGIAELIVNMASDNPNWGYTRIKGALTNVGYEVGRTTIKRVLLENGIGPAPERNKGMSWRSFLKAHLGAIAGMDFFTVEVVTLTGLVRYFVLVVIDLKTRSVEIAGIVHQPDGRWINQVARNLTDVCDGFLHDGYYVLHDRDPLSTAQFRDTLAAGGAMAVRLPAKSPNLNAHAERFVRSIKEECINRVVPLGERHLRTVVRQFMIHYHEERTPWGQKTVLTPLTVGGRRRKDVAEAQCAVSQSSDHRWRANLVSKS